MLTKVVEHVRRIKTIYVEYVKKERIWIQSESILNEKMDKFITYFCTTTLPIVYNSTIPKICVYFIKAETYLLRNHHYCT